MNRIFVESDVRILTGDVELHSFAGYGGGRKSILPGIAGRKTIYQNHSLLFHPNAVIGRLEGNPVHLDMMEAARLARVDFVSNVVLNKKGQIVKAFAGDYEQAFLKAVSFVDDMCKVPIQSLADIVIVSAGGFPYDINLFQSIKAVMNASYAIRKGGMMILVAECREGYGPKQFLDGMLKFRDSKDAEDSLRRNFSVEESVAYFLLKELEKARIILVSSLPEEHTKIFRMEKAKNVNHALKTAFEEVGKESRICIIPYGSRMLPVIAGFSKIRIS